ncbi:uncharacterized protein LOC143030918 isoform X2 [Oratosquilla oratoria]
MTKGKEDCTPQFTQCSHNGTSRNTTNPNEDTSLNVIRSNCYCDAQSCVRYGDCCSDLARTLWGDGREEGSDRYSCHYLSGTKDIGILMVGLCLHKYKDSQVEKLCLKQVPKEAYTYILDLPMTSSKTRVTYVNYHCAVCNDDANHLHIWNVTINCSTRQILRSMNLSDFMEKAIYQPGMLMWRRFLFRDRTGEKSFSFQQNLTCKLVVLEFADLSTFTQRFGGRVCPFPHKPCIKSAIGTPRCIHQVRRCATSWPDALDRAKCDRYSLLVFHRNENNRVTIYKNPHCARCNYVNVTSLSLKCECPNCGRRRPFFPRFPPCFSILMDLSRDRCPVQDELWDPVLERCVKIYCGALYELSNGRCVKNLGIWEQLRNSSLLDENCLKIRFTEEEYILRTDRSVFINATKDVYKFGEYELVNDSFVLICSGDADFGLNFDFVQSILSLVVLVISIVSLIFHIAIYLLVPRFRNLPGKNLLSLSFSLLFAQTLFLTSTKATFNYGFCVFLSVCLHYFWLASFCWMNVMSLDVCRTFTNISYKTNAHDNNVTFRWYSLYSWTVPLVIVVLALVVDNVDLLTLYRPEYATRLCWLNNSEGLALFFLLPVGAIVLENLVLFILSSYGIWKQARAARYANVRSQSIKQQEQSQTKEQKKILKKMKQQKKVQVPSRRERIRLKLYVRLAVLQGLTWVFGFVAALGDVRECWYPFIILNGLQGFFIFLGFDLKRKVLKSVWKALTGQSCMGHLRSTRDTRTTTLSTSDSPQVQTSTAAVTKKTSVSHAERTVGLSRPYTKPSPLQPRHLVQLPSQAPLKPLQHRRHPPPICNPNVHGRHEHSSGAALDSKPQEGERETESRLAAAEKALSSWLEPDKVDDVGESTDIRDGLDVSGSSSDEVPNCGNQRQVGPVSLTAGLRGGDLRAGVVRGHFKDEEASPHLMSSADGITDEDSLAPHPSSTLGLHCQSTQSLPPRASRVTAVPHLDRSRSHQLRRHANHEPLQELDSQTQDMQEHFSHSMPLLPSLLLPSHNPIPNQSRTHLLEMPQQEISPSLPPPPSLPTVPPTLTPTSQMHQELLHVQHRRDPLYFHPEQRRVRLDRMDAFGDASVDNEIYKVWTGSTLPEASFQDSGVRLVESHPHLPVVVDEGKCLAKSKSLSQISQAVLAATILKRSRQRSVPVSDPPPVTLPRTKDNYFDRDKGQEEIKSSRLCTQV